MTISKIVIQNIRGFDDTTLDVQFLPNKPNIFIAPNGFGKSTLSTAFNCARGAKLLVDEKDKHRQQEVRISLLKICHEGKWLTADETKNEVSEEFEISVIKSNIEAKAKMPRPNGFAVARPYLEISDLDLGPVPPKAVLNYNSSDYKILLAENSKLSPNLTKILNNSICSDLLSNIDVIDKLKQKRCTELFDASLLFLVAAKGTKPDIAQRFSQEFTSAIMACEPIKQIVQIIEQSATETNLVERFLLTFQLHKLIEDNRAEFKKWLQRCDFERRLSNIKAFINDINGGWVAANIKETKGRLIIKFPDANSLSNGQRDLLYFTCALIKVTNSRSQKPIILIIDEIFDYLDDANIVVAQYFLSKLIEDFKKEGRRIYLALLTHLDPVFFKGYALQKQNRIYLGMPNQSISNTMKKVILQRDDAVWKDDLSKYFLHYHPERKDISKIFNETYGLPKKHGVSVDFYDFLREHWEKLVEGAESYDPFAVCAHVRIAIERCAYEKIGDLQRRAEFLDLHGTAAKLELAESLNVNVPEVCFLLGVIYNDAMHRKDNLDQSSSIALKLKNIALQSVMKKAVAW
ncbi:AAA family ATPase [Brucella grignonensis]|uniref:AAA domain protein n=1 Tax=Brucella grignonensis TaxID=94627 RepID=A0A256F3C7_9HYPH|nr:AAA family ATPase [Brucella grignonensis]OYR09216.1 AAA domain protein [Brucella grignonensis]